MSNTYRCKCLRVFGNNSSYWKHLSTSQLPQCQNEYLHLLHTEYPEGGDEPMASSPTHSPEPIPPEDQLPSDPDSIPQDEGALHFDSDSQDQDLPPEFDGDDDDKSDTSSTSGENQDDQSSHDSDFNIDPDDHIDYDEDDEDDNSWEPPIVNYNAAATPSGSGPAANAAATPSGSGPAANSGRHSHIGRQNIENHLRQKITVEKFTDKYPLSHAGSTITNTSSQATSYAKYSSHISNSSNNPYAPFANRINWEIARWAKLRGPGSNAFSELLSIDGLAEKLNLTFKNTHELNHIIDEYIPGRPSFRCKPVYLDNEPLDLYYRPIIACIQSLFGDAEFARYLIFLPERHYADPDTTVRLWHDMHTGKWWWNTQKDLYNHGAKNATIIPIIISSDKTQLTMFNGKAAYPVYLTIGNLPKEIRRKPSKQGQILLAYLPVTKLEHITNESARRRMQANLFHGCLSYILEPIIEPGENGIPMYTGNGQLHSCHPIFAIHVGDYPEQCQVTCVKKGKCPTCRVDPEQLGDCIIDWMTQPPLYDLDAIWDAIDNPDHRNWSKRCEKAGIRPVFDPFWKNLPYADPFLSVAPDILHQIFQGIIKHVIGWLKKAYGEAELDARARRMPPNHHVRIFSHGFCLLTHLTGREHAHICRIILGAITGLPLQKNNSEAAAATVVRAVRAILDFAYLAQYPVHSTQTLDEMEDALKRFHENKYIFIDLGICSDFIINKLHYALHYRLMIERFGTTDNYNTEHTERLHIPYAKDAFDASNGKNVYPQMTTYVQRKEKILDHANYIAWCLDGKPSLVSLIPTEISQSPKMTKHPSKKSVSINQLVNLYKASMFSHALAHYVIKRRNPNLSYAQIEAGIPSIRLSHLKVAAYHKARFWLGSKQTYKIQSDEYDVVHCRPAYTTSKGTDVLGRFDTVLVKQDPNGPNTIQNFRIGQVKAIFSFTTKAARSVFSSYAPPPKYLAYIEWFTKFANEPEPDNLLYQVRKSYYEGNRVASIIPLANIHRSIHLFPKFDTTASRL
ncbi:hypothetical protein QCA50_011343 [Cerrena zonata]|uniref:Uncharacterized protein n=1 Tax=Cerrena zonata TaxID=2478898 RepID=A0AAW0G598_9APHY